MANTDGAFTVRMSGGARALTFWVRIGRYCVHAYVSYVRACVLWLYLPCLTLGVQPHLPTAEYSYLYWTFEPRMCSLLLWTMLLGSNGL